MNEIIEISKRMEREHSYQLLVYQVRLKLFFSKFRFFRVISFKLIFFIIFLNIELENIILETILRVDDVLHFKMGKFMF